MNKKGNSLMEACVVVLVIAMLMAVVIKVMPVFIAKQQLDTFTSELCRTAEISGNIGSNTTMRSEQLSKETGLKPTIVWSKTGDIQLNQEFTVTLTTTVNIGLFGDFASFPITLTAKATGVSEVYHK